MGLRSLGEGKHAWWPYNHPAFSLESTSGLLLREVSLRRAQLSPWAEESWEGPCSCKGAWNLLGTREEEAAQRRDSKNQHRGHLYFMPKFWPLLSLTKFCIHRQCKTPGGLAENSYEEAASGGCTVLIEEFQIGRVERLLNTLSIQLRPWKGNASGGGPLYP